MSLWNDFLNEDKTTFFSAFYLSSPSLLLCCIQTPECSTFPYTLPPCSPSLLPPPLSSIILFPPSLPPLFSSLPFLSASQQRMCLGERVCVCVCVCVREKRKAVSRMDMCPLSSTLSSSPPPLLSVCHLCLSSQSSASVAPWALSVPALGGKGVSSKWTGS